MEIPENIQNQLNQFQQLQQQAQAVNMQVQNVEVQIQETEKALEELKKTDENTEVFKQANGRKIRNSSIKKTNYGSPRRKSHEKT